MDTATMRNGDGAKERKRRLIECPPTAAGPPDRWARRPRAPRSRSEQPGVLHELNGLWTVERRGVDDRRVQFAERLQRRVGVDPDADRVLERRAVGEHLLPCGTGDEGE